jgi:hypothetical protein
LARILFCWELGSGFGHLGPIGALATEMTRAGHVCAIAARHVGNAHRHPGTRHLVLYQAPCLIGSTAIRGGAASYAELLLTCGYSDPETLGALVAAWRGLFDAFRPDLLVTESSPTTLVAARAAGIPAWAVGTGFAIPPDHEPMLALDTGRAIPATRLAAAETTALAVVNEVLETSRAPGLERLGGLFDSTRSALCTYAELDHYGVRPNARYWHITGTRACDTEPCWPAAGSGRPVFVYLHPGYPQFRPAAAAVARMGRPTLIVAPGIDRQAADRMRRPHLSVQAEPVDLDRVARRRPLVVSHGPHGTTAAFLRLGLPSLMLPRYVEQVVLALRVAGHGLSLAAHPDPRRHDYPLMLERLESLSAVHERAAAFAERYAGEHEDRTAAVLAHTILDASGF